MATLGFAEAFGKYKAKLKNVQWSVCAEAPDGCLVVSLWQHHFENPRDGTLIARGSFDRWSGPGNLEFREKVANAYHTKQKIKLVMVSTPEADKVEMGMDASRLKKTFSVREDLVGEVMEIDGEKYIFRFFKAR